LVAGDDGAELNADDSVVVESMIVDEQQEPAAKTTRGGAAASGRGKGRQQRARAVAKGAWWCLGVVVFFISFALLLNWTHFFVFL
jgi:hypothetical protein